MAIRTARYHGTLHLALHDWSASTKLATSPTLSAPDFPVLPVEVDAPGTYLVKVVKTDGASCARGGTAGDIVLRVAQP